jgi:hypothetical protein
MSTIKLKSVTVNGKHHTTLTVNNIIEDSMYCELEEDVHLLYIMMMCKYDQANGKIINYTPPKPKGKFWYGSNY